MNHVIEEYSQTEEKINWITHAIALVLSITGAIVIYLSLFTQQKAGAVKWISCTVYITSLILLYTASTSYHAIKHQKWKHRFRIADHIAIYVKIAGTYTPFLVLVFPPAEGIPWLILLWSLVISGIFFKLFLVRKFNIASTILYLAMGWIAVFMVHRLYSSLAFAIFICIVAGGFFFTAGVFFYLAKKIPFGHSIWHAFVMAGSGCHFVGIYMLISN